MAPPQAYLKKVGMEMFALLEETERHKARPTHQPYHVQVQPQPHHYGVRNVPRKEPMDFFQAAQLYGGMIILNGHNKKLFP
ncbi:hypothetical protein FRX31_024876 [Thalictrum thalictroides]|uniref:Uncharacterized protein n=1 Tax=Thalictrum thalictroides TaxID=46969 RepID=A0A7J6VLR8_THATH|nr:hypothetical protein FRX31_024876 [Thalictrum thalictroides]